MSGNTKFELSSVSPEDSGLSGNYSNGKRGSHPGPSLDRSGSFREGSESRSFSSGTGTYKMNNTAAPDLQPLSQFLNSERILMGHKYKQAVEMREAGFSFGNVAEDILIGAGHSNPPTLATDELKHFRASVRDGYMKARTGVKRWDDSINKLSKYLDPFNPKKQQPNERSGGSTMMKMGSQSYRSPSNVVSQKLEERNKNMVLNKRARTPIGDLLGEGRSNGLPRQLVAVGKEKGAVKKGNSDLVDEKIRRLPVGGEEWDRKIKRKRTMSSVFSKPLDSDGELKRTMHGRPENDSAIQNSDSHGCSLNGINKLDGTASHVGLSARMTPKNELEKSSLSRELTGMNKERLSQKGNTKFNLREGSHLFGPGSVTKGKASRTHRMGPAVVGNPSPSLSHISGASEDWEQPLSVNKLHSLDGVTNRKRPLPTESSSPPMAQWVGQRPQKISRNRRTNIVSPTSNHDEVHILTEGCASDLSPKIPSGMNESLPVRNMTTSSQQLKTKLENATSPARLYECEQNSAGQNKLKDKSLGGSEGDEKGINGHQHVSPSTLLPKKSKFLVKEEIRDVVRRQGRTGRDSSFSRSSMSPLKEKLQHSAIGKPARSTRPGSEKNGSKSGRPPLKKHLDRKGLTHVGAVSNSNSPDFTGESDDDHEELLEAAHFARHASYISSLFWKRMEAHFHNRLGDKLFLDKQLKSVNEFQPNLREMSDVGHNILNHVHYMKPQSFVPGEGKKKCTRRNGLPDLFRSGDVINHFMAQNSSYGRFDSEKGSDSLTPLYQRVLSALVVEEFEENNFVTNATSLAHRDEPFVLADRISCNGNATHRRFSSFQVPTHEEMEEANCGYMHPQTRPQRFQNDANRSLAIITDVTDDFSPEHPYDQMSMDDKLLFELQSVGLYPETVPDLAEAEDELINEDIMQLKKILCEEIGNKKVHLLDRLHKTIEGKKEFEERELEQRAMNSLTELAFRKLLATRGNLAAKMGIGRVPRHVALAFIKRILARCRRFEDGGKSCFTEPALRDALFAEPSNDDGAINYNIQTEQYEQEAGISGSRQLNKSERNPFDINKAPPSQSDHAVAKNGPLLNRGKKKEVFLDGVGANSSRSNLPGGAKGKRTERDPGSKVGRPPITNSKGDRKTKSKPKQKAPPSQISTHPVQPSSVKERNEPMDFSNMPLDLDAIDGLGVGNEFGGPQDLISWLDFDEDNLQDHDSMGLEIPMDDLSGLNIPL